MRINFNGNELEREVSREELRSNEIASLPRIGEKLASLTDHSTSARDKKNVRKRNEAVTSGTEIIEAMNV